MLAKTYAEYQAEGRNPEILFWVGCAGSYDARAQKVTRAVCEILHHVGIEFAILGQDERCTGDPARRAGNEFLFQMTAMMNIEMKNIITQYISARYRMKPGVKFTQSCMGGSVAVVRQ